MTITVINRRRFLRDVDSKFIKVREKLPKRMISCQVYFMVFLWKVSYATLFPSRPQWDLKYDNGGRVRQRSGTEVTGRGNRRQWRKIGFHSCRGSEGTGGTGWFHLQSFVERRSTVKVSSCTTSTCLSVCFALFVVVVVVVAIVFFQN